MKPTDSLQLFYSLRYLFHNIKRAQPTIPAYTQLKRKWKTSIVAMFRRSYHLGIISMSVDCPWQNTDFFRIGL